MTFQLDEYDYQKLLIAISKTTDRKIRRRRFCKPASEPDLLSDVQGLGVGSAFAKDMDATNASPDLHRTIIERESTTNMKEFGHAGEESNMFDISDDSSMDPEIAGNKQSPASKFHAPRNDTISRTSNKATSPSNCQPPRGIESLSSSATTISERTRVSMANSISSGTASFENDAYYDFTFRSPNDQDNILTQRSQQAIDRSPCVKITYASHKRTCTVRSGKRVPHRVMGSFTTKLKSKPLTRHAAPLLASMHDTIEDSQMQIVAPESSLSAKSRASVSKTLVIASHFKRVFTPLPRQQNHSKTRLGDGFEPAERLFDTTKLQLRSLSTSKRTGSINNCIKRDNTYYFHGKVLPLQYLRSS